MNIRREPTCHGHYELISKFNVLKTLLLASFSEPGIYDDLVYKLVNL